jgi:hypothetical protein
MTNEHPDDQALRRYILGELSGEEKERIERLLLEDGELFELCEAIEAEVLADHARGRLTAAQGRRIATLMAVSPDIRFRRAVIGRLQAIARSERVRRFGWAALAATILLAVSSFWWTRGAIQRPQVSAEYTPPTTSETLLSSDSDISPPPEPTPPPPPPPPLMLAISLSGLRGAEGGEEDAKHVIPSGTKEIELQFFFDERPAAAKYEVSLTDSGGAQILSQPSLKLKAIEGGHVALVVRLPAAKLKSGRYTATFKPIPADADVEITKDFEVVRSLSTGRRPAHRSRPNPLGG